MNTVIYTAQAREFKHPNHDTNLPRQYRISVKFEVQFVEARSVEDGWLVPFNGEVRVSSDRHTVVLIPKTPVDVEVAISTDGVE